MTGGGGGMTESAETTAGTEAASETCNSSLGTPISALAHKRVRKKTGTRIRHGIMPRDTLPPSSLYTPPLRPSPASSLHTPPLRPSPASFLHAPPSRPSPGVIPVHAAVTSTTASFLHTPPLRPPRRHSCEGRNLNANSFL